MLYLRYSGEFLSRASVRWRVEIWQEADSAFEVGDLTFEGEEPLVIEWDVKSKEESVCGSTATLQIESPGDRTYIDLYTIKPGNIRMDVYREDTLYWSGALDPEFYEEPYERGANYTVSFTFSDFGILDRLNYDLEGFQKLSDILEYAIEKSGLNLAGIDYSTYCSTYFDGGTEKADLSALSIDSRNFFDEEDEPTTLKDVLTAILQPLALRMTQKAGYVWVYDLNGLYESAETREIKWDGASQTLGVDKVANDVVITFSPYSSSSLLGTDIVYTDKYSPDAINRTNNNPNDPDYGEYYSYYPDYSSNDSSQHRWDYDNIDFTIFISENGTGVNTDTRGSGAAPKFFHIEPVFGSEESDGLAWSFYTGGHGSLKSGYPVKKLGTCDNTTRSNGATSNEMMATEPVSIPPLSEEDAAGFYLKVKLEMLLDARYNPFNTKGEYNEEGNYDDFKTFTGWAFVPVAIDLTCPDGTQKHYVNSSYAADGYAGTISFIKYTGEWADGAASLGDCWLEYYDTSDQKDSAGILGWQTNRHCIGRNDGKSGREENLINDSFKNIDDGQYIPYPPEGGTIVVTVYKGVDCYDYGESKEWRDTDKWDSEDLYDKVRWFLYKAPKIDIVRNNVTFDDAESEDIEYRGYLNKDANDEITIDTICGTCDTPCPTAKGAYCKADGNIQIQTLTRAGVSDHPEKLLIGTLYSQFAERKTSLEGDAVLDYGGLCSYSEQNQAEGVKFICTGEVQDVISDVSDMTIIEYSPDQYQGLTYG